MRENFILKSLFEDGKVVWNPKGNSMTPKVESGDQVILKQCINLHLYVGDIVYAKVKGNYYLHLISVIDGERYQISNNHGYVNGWTKRDCIYGICVQVKDKVILSDEELKNRVKSIT
jgi:phage repressor protein C with HTH and peptisase S24 domain